MQPAELHKLLADETRLRLLVLLAREGELCVCELSHALGAIQPKISRHLAVLREGGLVLARRQGQWIYYRLCPDLPRWVQDVLGATARGAARQEPFTSDRAALRGMPDRPGANCCA